MSAVVVITDDPAIVVKYDEAEVEMVLPVSSIAAADWVHIQNKPSFGTAANLDAGAGVGDVVQIDGNGKLPALDGSQLTGLQKPFGCGRLSYTNSTTITFAPFKGAWIQINGAFYLIPSGGITASNASLGNNGSFYVYAYINAGNLTLEVVATGHATSAAAGNVGTEIKSGDDSRTLVGQIRTNASGNFVDTAAQRFVRSWFNDPGCILTGAGGLTGSTSSASATYVETSTSERVQFLVWAGELVSLIVNGTASCTSAGSIYINIGIDSASPAATETGVNLANANYQCPVTVPYVSQALSEGYHYATILFAAIGGSVFFYGPNIGGNGARVTGILRGK